MPVGWCLVEEGRTFPKIVYKETWHCALQWLWPRAAFCCHGAAEGAWWTLC